MKHQQYQHQLGSPQQSLNQRFRVSIRVSEEEKFMIIIDLSTYQSVDQLIQYLCDTFHVMPPSPIEIERDEAANLILVLEPDIIIHDIEAIQREDNLILTSRKKLRAVHQQVHSRGFGYSYSQLAGYQSQQHQNPQDQNNLFDPSTSHLFIDPQPVIQQPCQAVYQQQPQYSQNVYHNNYSPKRNNEEQFLDQKYPQYPQQPQQPHKPFHQSQQSTYYGPRRLDVKREKHVNQQLVETDNMQEFYQNTLNIGDSNFLMQKLNEMSLCKGFKIYRHSEGQTNRREQKLILLCQHYQQMRCPFLLIYKKYDESNAAYHLIKYRPEHNHTLQAPQQQISCSQRESQPSSSQQQECNQVTEDQQISQANISRSQYQQLPGLAQYSGPQHSSMVFQISQRQSNNIVNSASSGLVAVGTKWSQGTVPITQVIQGLAPGGFNTPLHPQTHGLLAAATSANELHLKADLQESKGAQDTVLHYC